MAFPNQTFTIEKLASFLAILASLVMSGNRASADDQPTYMPPKGFYPYQAQDRKEPARIHAALAQQNALQSCMAWFSDKFFPDPAVANIRAALQEKLGSSIDYAPDQLFLVGGSTRYIDTGRGSEYSNADLKRFFYPLKKRWAEAYLQGLELGPAKLALLPSKQAYVMTEMWRLLSSEPAQVTRLQSMLARPSHIFNGEEYVFDGPGPLELFNPETHLDPNIPPSRQNIMFSYRKFDDDFQSLERYEYQGNGKTGYSRIPLLEGREVRAILKRDQREVGYIDGTYVNVVGHGEPRGKFRTAYRYNDNIIGEVLEVKGPNQTSRYLLLPKTGIEFFYKP